MLNAKLLFFYLSTCIIGFCLNGCIVDIPSPRPDGPILTVYGNVINSNTKEPISNAVISDGFSTTLTDKSGKYSIKTFPGAKFVFISVPELYEIPMNDGMTQIFKSIDISKDSVQVNFYLTPLKN